MPVLLYGVLLFDKIKLLVGLLMILEESGAFTRLRLQLIRNERTEE